MKYLAALAALVRGLAPSNVSSARVLLADLTSEKVAR